MHNPAASSFRYAIYFSPAEVTPLALLGNAWLGCDSATHTVSAPELPEEMPPAEWLNATGAPRRYGFHATLKPPFRLAEGTDPQELRRALSSFAARKTRITAPPLTLGTLGHFLALILSEPCMAFSDLASDCVRDFDHFRAPATEAETNQRMGGTLTQQEREHLLTWGYPYVLDTWKFHMTLTGSLPAGPLAIFREHLSHRFAEVCEEPLCADSVCLYEESSAGMPFRLLERFRLGL